MTIQVVQNADGTIGFSGATLLTLKQTGPDAWQLGVVNDTLAVPVDTGPALAAKITKATADLAAASADLGKVGADLV